MESTNSWHELRLDTDVARTGVEMIVECPHCKTRYSLPGEKAHRRRAVAQCKKCQKQIVIQPEPPDEPIHEPVPEIEEPSDLAVDTFNALLEADFPQIRALPQSRYAFWKIFSPNAEGGYKNSANAQKFKMLMATAPVLDELWQENEKVIGMAGVINRRPVDWLMLNLFLSSRYNHYALIATIQRLVLINIDKRMTNPLHYIYFEFLLCALIWLVVLDAITANQSYQLSMALYLVLVYNASVGIVTFFLARRGAGIHKKAIGKET